MFVNCILLIHVNIEHVKFRSFININIDVAWAYVHVASKLGAIGMNMELKD